MLKKTIPVLVALTGGCTDACDNTIINQTTAPDGRSVAILFQRDCGATTSSSTQISVLAQGQHAVGAGNLFRADDNHGATKAASWGSSWAEAVWISPQHLLIRYDAKSRIFEQVPRTAGVNVTYQAVNR